MWMEFSPLLGHVGLMYFMLLLSGSINIQGREHYLFDFIEKNPTFKVGFEIIQLQINFFHTWLDFDASLDDVNLYSRSQLYEK